MPLLSKEGSPSLEEDTQDLSGLVLFHGKVSHMTRLDSSRDAHMTQFA